MIRPALFSTTQRQRAVGRNLALDTVASIGVGVTVALVTTLLPTIARRGGLEPIGLAALAAAPFIANLLGAFAGQVGGHAVVVVDFLMDEPLSFCAWALGSQPRCRHPRTGRAAGKARGAWL